MRLLRAFFAFGTLAACLVANGAWAATFVVNTTADEVDVNLGDGVCAGETGRCALRAAIVEANALPGTDFILLGPGLYRLTIEGAGEDEGRSGDLDVLDDLFVQGDGRGAKIIDGGGLDRVLEVHAGAALDLSGVTLTGGQGGIVNRGKLSFLDGAVRDCQGPGIDNFGDLLVLNAVIERNVSPIPGAGLCNRGSMTLANAKVRRNATIAGAAGGGVFAALGSQSTIFNTAIEQNAADGAGGGIASETLNVAVSLDDPNTPEEEKLVAILPVPRILPRLVAIAPSRNGPQRFIFLSDIIKLCAGELFGGYKILGAFSFRVTRNSDLYIDEEEAENLLKKIEEELRNLRRGAAVRLEIDEGVHDHIFETLCDHLELSQEYVFRLNGPINLLRLSALADLDRPDLKFPTFTPVNASPLRETAHIFDTIRHQDVLLHHPYDSFMPVVDFVEQAARDPQVFAIKQTLYRTSGDSPI
ncbi:MAG: CSLREA domain-containing protein, partial [Myxococcales bacterium]|nr:CSLREA domain-containing protein [Myxococcales bacterium]